MIWDCHQTWWDDLEWQPDKYTAWAMLATASAQVCVPLGHSSLIFKDIPLKNAVTLKLGRGIQRILRFYNKYLVSFLRYSMLKNIATLKSRSGVNRGHWKWYRSIDWIWFPISVFVTNKTLRYSTSKMPWPWKAGLWSVKVIRMSPFDRAHMISY